MTKATPVSLDLGNLAVFDINRLNITVSGGAQETFLLDLSRDNLQTLVDDLFNLPTERTEDGPLVKLPEPHTPLPRSKPIPQKRELTRWEQFAKAKGIQKRKKGSHKFDEERQEWRPRFGGKSAKNDSMNNWITELKPRQEFPDEE